MCSQTLKRRSETQQSVICVGSGRRTAFKVALVDIASQKRDPLLSFRYRWHLPLGSTNHVREVQINESTSRGTATAAGSRIGRVANRDSGRSSGFTSMSS